MIRLVLADDQQVIRDGIKYIVEKCPEIKVVGCASNGLEAFNICMSLMPDLVLMDIVMPVCDGIASTKLIKSKCPSTKVIILTTFSDEIKIFQALRNGADGYILKDVDAEVLTTTIKSTLKGLSTFNNDILGKLINQEEQKDEIPLIDLKCMDFNLTNRERDIIKYIVYGKSNKETALILNLSVGSVRNMISGILSKLKLKDRTQLAVFAVKNNVI